MSSLSRTRFAVPLILVCAVTAFATSAGWMSERLGTWSEEVSVYPSTARLEAKTRSDDTLELVTCKEDGALQVGEARPRLRLCLGDEVWPVMVDSYFAGWLYWPLAAVVPKNVFAQRKLGLLFGVGSLLLGFLFLARWLGRWEAAAGAAVVSVSSSFVFPHALLVHFEVVLLPLVAVAGWLVARVPAGERLGAVRGTLVALFMGLAVAANIKAVFLLAGLAVFAWPDRQHLPRPGRLTVLVAGCAFLIPLLPMLVFAMTDAKGGFEAQIGYRLENIFARISTLELFAEPLNLLRFWTDIGSYGEEAAKGVAHWPISPQLVPAVALVWSGWHLVRRFQSREHAPAVALLGALVWTYMLAGATLYDQRPAANYAPLHAAFGLLAGACAVRIGRWVAARVGVGERWGKVVTGLLVTWTVLSLAYSTFHRGDPAKLPMATNAVAQRKTVDALRQLPGTIITVGHNLAGVLESISEGDIRTIDATPYLLTVCANDDEYDEACAVERWGSLITRVGEAWVVIPEQLALSDEPRLATAARALESLRRGNPFRTLRHQRFSGSSTPPVLSIWRFARTGE